ncbi:MAG: hypothetical protein IPK07_08935 [Deltaproteobacteria bacterium]|nr:hypothetical protein [Deltaproteobacteria bacterium]
MIAPNASSGSLADVRAAALAVVLLTVLAYAPGLRAPFTYDDRFLVERSPVVTGVAPLGDAFSRGYWEGIASHRGNEYRPLTLVALALEHRLFGQASVGYRVVSWLLHLACVAAVAALAVRLGLGGGAPMVAALVFALHPLHVEAVTGIVGQGELLQTALAVAAVLAFVTHGTVAALAWPVLTLAALLAKESAVVTPALAALTAAWIRARRGPAAARSPLAAAAVVPLLVGYVWVRAQVLGGVAGVASVSALENPLVDVALPGRIVAGAWLLARYAWLHPFPVELSIDWGLACLSPPTRLTEVAGLTSVAACAGVAIVVARRLRSLESWVVGWFALSLAIAANVAFPIGTIFGERLAYLASVGVAIGGGAALAALARWRPRAARPLLVALAGLLAIRTATRNLDFSSSERLFRAAVEVCPASVKARYNLAVLVAEDGALGEALEHLDAALAVRPTWGTALAARGRIRWLLGEHRGAAADFEAAQATDGHDPVALAGLGDVARAAGDCARAVAFYDAALAVAPGDLYARGGRAACVGTSP